MSPPAPPRVRAEVLRFPRPDGGLDLLDPVLGRLHRLGPAEAAALADGVGEVVARLEREALLEGPAAEAVREACYAARVRAWPAAAPAPAAEGGEDAPWDDPTVPALPALLAAPWREGERYRRLAEERRAGQRALRLPGLLAAPAAEGLRRAAAALPTRRLETDVVRAGRCLLTPDQLPEVWGLLCDEGLRRTLGRVLGVPLPDRLVVNAWRMGPGDGMAVHPDGPDYAATLSLGLAAAWTAARGGAIAFGVPTPAGLDVRERWLPHLGDALLFVPEAGRSWHAVEPVVSGERLTLTAWWLK